MREVKVSEFGVVFGGDAAATREPGQNSYGEWTTPRPANEPGLGNLPTFGFFGAFGGRGLKILGAMLR